jgi:hypothetical protein
LPLALGLACAGCRSNNCDLVEAELRTRELQLADLRAQRDQLHAYNDALQREIAALRGGTPLKLSPEEASQTFTLRSIVLGRQTGGLDDDGHPGDEALQVLVEPRDQDGHTIKVPGNLTIRAVEITPEGLKHPLSAWDVSGDTLRRSWKSGLLTSGYYLVLPWKVCPSTEKVRVVAQFVLSDGRTFEAEKDVTVRLVPLANRPPPAFLPEAPEGPSLPTPRKVDESPVPGWRAPPPRPAAGDPAGQRQPPKKPSLVEAVEFRAPVPLPPH